MKQWLTILLILAGFFLAITGMFKLTMQLTSTSKTAGLKQNGSKLILIDNKEASYEIDAIREWLTADAGLQLSVVSSEQTDTILKSNADLVIVAGKVSDLFNHKNDINGQTLLKYISDGGKVLELALIQSGLNDCQPSARGVILPVGSLQGIIPEAASTQLYSNYLLTDDTLLGEPLLLASRPNRPSITVLSKEEMNGGVNYRCLINPWQTAGQQWILNRIVRFILGMNQPIWDEKVSSGVLEYSEIDSSFCMKYREQKRRLSGSPEEVIEALSWIRVTQPPMSSQLLMSALKSSDITVREYAIRLLTNGGFREALPLLKRLKRDDTNQEMKETLDASIERLSKPL